MMDYQPKNLIFDQEGRDKLVAGISKISNAVKSTLGPRGKTVLIESDRHVHGICVTKDGVTVAKAIDLLDPVENLAVRIMREAADRTATDAGDGTTTSVVIAEALVRSGLELITPEHNVSEVLSHLSALSEQVVSQLKANSRRVTRKTISDVASISCNNDRAMGKLIADTYNKVGKSGLVTVEKSQGSETYFEVTRGLKIHRGWTSPLFINDQRRDECVFEDTHVLVCDAEISNFMQLNKILGPIFKAGQSILIVAPCTTNVTNTMAANVMKNGLKACNIAPPNFGYRQHELMQDLAVALGAKYFSEKTGDDLSLIELSDLGFAKKVVVGKDSTVIVRAEQADTTLIDIRLTQLKAAQLKAKVRSDKDFLSERIASLVGGVGVIFVGGNTDLEQKELYDRVDDAVCACRSALEEGVVAGGGKALLDVRFETPAYSEEMSVAIGMLRTACIAPILQIHENAGMSAHLDDPDYHVKGYGFDVKNRKWGDMFDMGIVDPLKVTRCALENAVSVASTILSTNAIITMARSYETK